MSYMGDKMILYLSGILSKKPGTNEILLENDATIEILDAAAESYIIRIYNKETGEAWLKMYMEYDRCVDWWPKDKD